MFDSNGVFNQPIGGWNTARVTDILRTWVCCCASFYPSLQDPQDNVPVKTSHKSFKCETHLGTHSILMGHPLRSPFGLEIPVAVFAGQTQQTHPAML